jgi:biopolymer transport protein ExbD
MRAPQSLGNGTATINMTPMIDVVFLLIIFFLVSNHLVQQENRVQLNLPKAGSGDQDDQRESLTVNILADGRWQTGGINVNETELSNVLRRRAASASGSVQLRIRMDREVPYERLEPVLGVATQLGIGDVAFSVYEDRGR